VESLPPVLLWFAIVFCLVLLVCWIVLPFAVIGLKPLVRELIREQRRTNELLARSSAEAPAPVSARANDSHRYPPSHPLNQASRAGALPPT
jgi:threonine/homoserine/homoserine lactone efflux protein